MTKLAELEFTAMDGFDQIVARHDVSGFPGRKSAAARNLNVIETTVAVPLEMGVSFGMNRLSNART